MFVPALLMLALASNTVSAGMVKVYHSIYNGPNVDVCVGATALYANLAFNEQTYYINVAAGSYDIDVRVANTIQQCTGVAVISAGLNVDNGAYTVIAHGDGDVNPYELLPLSDDPTNTVDESAIRFVHACAGAPNVDVIVNGAVAFRDIAYENLAEAVLAAGTYNIRVNVTNTETTVFGPVDIAFRGESGYTIFASGSVNDLPLTPFVSLDSTASVSEVRVLHAVSKLGAPTVDVWINGVNALPDFEYSDITDYIPLASLATQVEIFLAGTNTSVFPRATYNLANAFYTLVAHGQALPIAVLPLIDNNSNPSAGNVAVRFVHVSAGSPVVDVIADDEVLFGGVAYGSTGVPTYAVVPHKTYEIAVNVAADDSVVVGPVDLKLSSDKDVVTIFALGNAGETGRLGLTALAVEDAPMPRKLNFENPAAATIPSAVLVIASLLLAFLY